MSRGFYMNDPNIADFWITVQKSTPGFFGSMVAALLVQRPRNWIEMSASVAGGTATAYFIAPFVAHFIGQSTAEGISALGFGTGMCAVLLMPSLMRRVQHLIGRWEGTWPPKFEPPDVLPQKPDTKE